MKHLTIRPEGRGTSVFEGSRRLAYELSQEAAQVLATERLSEIRQGARFHAAIALAHAASAFGLLSLGAGLAGRVALLLVALHVGRALMLHRRST